MEVVGDTTPPQDTTDLNPFSVLPQNEEIENPAPPPGLPPEPDPTTQVATPAASTLPPQVEKIPSTDVDAILSHLYIEDSAAEPQADSTPGKPTSPEKQPPISQPELNESPTAMVTQMPTSVHPQLPDTPLESYTTTFYGHPPRTMETKRTWNLNKTINGKPPPCPPELYLLRTNKRAPSILIKRNTPGKVGKLYLLC